MFELDRVLGQARVFEQARVLEHVLEQAHWTPRFVVGGLVCTTFTFTTLGIGIS
jgi:3-phosphoglycerate kinase